MEIASPAQPSKYHYIEPYLQHQCSKPYCRASFIGRTRLKYHEMVHDNIQLKCIFCPFTTVEASNLMVHQRQHFGVRAYQCEICNLVYTTQGVLNYHFKTTHSGIRTKCFKCRDFLFLLHQTQNQKSFQNLRYLQLQLIFSPFQLFSF